MTISLPSWFILFVFFWGLSSLIADIIYVIVNTVIWIDRWSHRRAWEKCHQAAYKYEYSRIRGANSQLILIDTATNF